MTTQMSPLAQFIQENLVATSWGDYDGIKEPTLPELYALQGLVAAAITEAQKAKS